MDIGDRLVELNALKYGGRERLNCEIFDDICFCFKTGTRILFFQYAVLLELI